MFKLAVETVDDQPSLVDGTKVQERGAAIMFYDRVREAERRRNVMGRSLYTNVALLTDVREDAPNGWESADPEFPWIVDGESFPPFEDCPRGCGARVRTDRGWKYHFDYDCPVPSEDEDELDDEG